jgi:peptidoglycan-associated lipoprotein
MGDTMKRCFGKFALVAALGLALLSAQGCSMKWLQSDGEEGKNSADGGWNGQGVNPNFPGMGQGGSRNDLSGFSQNPSDEYLSQGAGIASISPANAGIRHRAELTKEERAAEKAAMEAGLQDVFFGYDEWTLSNSGMESLNYNAKWLKEHPGAVLKVEGHCDERGTSDYNMVLGDKRSKSARSYLSDMGVSPKQIAIVSYGKERPFCMEHDESCYRQNRRGHVLLNLKKQK